MFCVIFSALQIYFSIKLNVNYTKKYYFPPFIKDITKVIGNLKCHQDQVIKESALNE